MTGVLIKREKFDTETGIEGRQCEETWGNMANYKPRKEA